MLHVHHAERSDRLVAALAEVFREPLDDPLATEVVAVHSRGIERWIAQELSLRLGTGALGDDGVAANIEFPFPSKLIHQAVARGSGLDPETDPWTPERLTWPLLELVDADPDAPMLGPLRAHIDADPANDDRVARRFGSVRHIADLFDRYAVHRPEMVLAWAKGDDVGPDEMKLADRHRWQPKLWRAVRKRVDIDSPAERYHTALERLREDGGLIDDLPPRLALFGLTALPASYLGVLDAIAAHRDVHLLLLHPSGALWDRLAEDADGQRLHLRDADDTADAPRNPLLRTWGRDARELQLVTPLPADRDQRHDHTDPAPSAPATLLQRVQADVHADRAPGGDDRPRLDPEDHTVQVHACHGRLRQVEVLRDAILHLLADDPTLEPRDIIVLCPDIEAFAPLVTAVFGADEVRDDDAPQRDDGDAPPALKVRLADRSLRRTNPVLEVVSLVLDLVDARVAVSSVLDLAGRAPVRRRFRFDEDQLATLENWIVDVNIRWGLDADHRVEQGLPALDANTWRAGLERLLLGVAIADEYDRMIDDVVPYDHVEGSDSDLAGRLVELVARLSTHLQALRGPMTIDAWRDAIGEAADALTLVDEDAAWERRQLDGLLADLVDEATSPDGVAPVALSLGEMRALLAQRLEGRPTRTSHRTGDLTVCTLVPMRSVPHRVVCLLGLDDGAFPRQAVPDADDLLLRAPRVGDRDPRSEDRQLLLDAVLAARDALVVTYAGRDVRTNEPRPPAVPVDELLDVVDRTVTTVDGLPARRHVTTHHPLTAHDPRNFEPDGPQRDAARPVHPGSPWGFQPESLAAARARRRGPEPVPPFLAGELPLPDEDGIDLDDLVAFVQHPVKAFVNFQLDLKLRPEDDPIPESIPSSLKGLDAWSVGEAALQAWLSERDPDQALAVACARGIAPPEDLLGDAIEKVREDLHRIIGLCQHVGIGPARRRHVIDVEVELGDGRTLAGSVPSVMGTQIEQVSFSRIAPKHRLATWVRWLALTVSDPEQPWQAVTAGKHKWRKGKAHAVTLPPFAPDPEQRRERAAALLAEVVDLYDRGRRHPLPLYCETSAKIADNLKRGIEVDKYVDKDWETNPHQGFAKEDLDPYHLLVLGGRLSAAELFAEPCRELIERGWWRDGDQRVVSYAWRLWEPVLRHERSKER